jgi:hypothetical protein
VAEKWCDSCLMAGKRVPATTRSTHPDYAKFDLCEECAAKLNAREALEKTQSPSPDLGASATFPRGGGGYSASARVGFQHHKSEMLIKMGGKHFRGCICPICGGLDGKHTHLCSCPICGAKDGKHRPYCSCPQCSELGGKHHPYCECPVCHRLG